MRNTWGLSVDWMWKPRDGNLGIEMGIERVLGDRQHTMAPAVDIGLGWKSAAQILPAPSTQLRTLSAARNSVGSLASGIWCARAG